MTMEMSTTSSASMKSAEGRDTNWILVQFTPTTDEEGTLGTVLCIGPRAACARFADRIPAWTANFLAIIPHDEWNNLEETMGYPKASDVVSGSIPVVW